jgi:alkylresorcinol/alkylpyrone synthase
VRPAPASRIAAAAVALPGNVYPQDEITAAFARVVGLPPERDALLHRLHEATGVRQRHLVLPLADYARLDGFGAANDAHIAAGLELGEQAVKQALAHAGVAPAEVDVLLVTSVTGVAAPSLDARLVARLGLRADVRRIPVFGLGCVAGAAGVGRVHDLLRGDPDGVAVLLAVETCSLTVQRDDTSTANLVASGLFGDGAAAVVVVGERRAGQLDGGQAGPDVVATRSRLYPDSGDVMGWDIGGSGFRVVLSTTVADVVDTYLGGDVRTFLADHGLVTGDVQRWVAHPGGPKVLQAMARALAVPDAALHRTWQSLAAVGNLSSVSVLHVLSTVLAEPPPAPGSFGMMLAMGPGFCSELVLLRWPGSDGAVGRP